ncbi:MAG TPA: TRAP transporter substrate-binding protein DctP [Elusimicrobiota bacterium]|nr:TRAP transporter substrate-binding protein DctP [Elusimicrobiota bacterium]
MNSFKLAVLSAVLLAAPARAELIKFATLAPEGTDAAKIMQAIDAELRAKTSGQLGFKFYLGGRQGDEKDMVRKIRLGQLQAGGFTGVGLGEIAPEVRVMDAPWLFRNSDEVDHVLKTFDADFRKDFENKGFVLLGWTEIGFIYVFTNTPVKAPIDMQKLKIWMWEGDPIAESAFKALDVHPIPLSITDVNTSLQTKLIDSVYSAPLYAIALQWTDKTKYIYNVPMANASGAVLVSKKAFDALPKDQQKLLLDVGAKHLSKLNALTREENRKALESLKAHGMIMTDTTPEQLRSYEALGRKARRELVGRLYSAELLDRVEKSLAEYRAKSGAAKAPKAAAK